MAPSRLKATMMTMINLKLFAGFVVAATPFGTPLSEKLKIRSKG